MVTLEMAVTGMKFFLCGVGGEVVAQALTVSEHHVMSKLPGRTRYFHT